MEIKLLFLILIVLGVVATFLINSRMQKRKTEIIENNRDKILQIIEQSSSHGAAVDEVHKKYNVTTIQASDIVNQLNSAK